MDEIPTSSVRLKESQTDNSTMKFSFRCYIKVPYIFLLIFGLITSLDDKSAKMYSQVSLVAICYHCGLENAMIMQTQVWNRQSFSFGLSSNIAFLSICNKKWFLFYIEEFEVFPKLKGAGQRKTKICHEMRIIFLIMQLLVTVFLKFVI